jgi:integrase
MPAKSTRPPRSRKSSPDRPAKPYPEFPLCPATNGRWQKKINGKSHYFGRWGRVVNGKMDRIEGDGWQEALALFKAQADDLHAGRTPRAKSDELTIRDLCNRFLTAKKHKLDAGEMTQQTFDECFATAKRLADQFGGDRLVDDLAADDFESLRAEMAKRWGPVRLGNEIGRTKSVFKYAIDNRLIERPVAFGSEFRKPSKAVMRKHRADGGQRLFDAAEVRALLDAASPQLKAMILLGINAAFGNHDCATLPTSAVDGKGGWVRFPRPKTGIERRCPLWPETVEALRAVTAKDGFVFAMKCSRRANAVTRAMGRLLHNLGINGRRGLGFYTLRHTFRTIADSQRDFPAIRIIMGHADGSIDDAYREHVDDARLKAVTDHVRNWLFG